MFPIKTASWINLKINYDSLLHYGIEQYFGLDGESEEDIDDAKIQFNKISKTLNSIIQNWEIEFSENHVNCEQSRFIPYVFIIEQSIEKWEREITFLYKDITYTPQEKLNKIREGLLTALNWPILTCKDILKTYKLEVEEIAIHNSMENYSDLVNEMDGKQPVKIKWLGTPGEFGSIMDKLIGGGYIAKIADLKNTVRLLHEHFEVKNEKGIEVNSTYLYKCFDEKKRKYFPDEFKLAQSDNYGKV